MPNFPTYYGPPLPRVLNPLNPAHYWVVFKWVFFQPSRLKYYLHQSNPELYRVKGRKALSSTLHAPAYRNLYLITLVVAFFTAVGAACTAGAMQPEPIDWSRRIPLWIFAEVAGIGSCMVYGVTNGVANGVAWYVGISLPGAVALSAAGNLNMVDGVVLGMAIVATLGMVMGVAWGATGGTAIAVIIGGLGVTFGIAWGVLYSIAVIIGVLRLPFYLFEMLWVGLLKFLITDQSQRLMYHPAFWDELATLPMSGLCPLFRPQLNDNFEEAMRIAVNVAANPFQRWAIQRTLADWIISQSDPLTALQRIVHWPPLTDYIAPPLNTQEQFRDFPPAQIVVVGEIGEQLTDGRAIYLTSRAERLAWLLTRPLRHMQPAPMSHFSAMLYELLRDEVTIEEQKPGDIQLEQRFSSAYEGVRIYPHGSEAANSWANIGAFLEMTMLEQISTAYEHLTWIPEIPQPYLTPETIATLTALGDVSRSVAASLQATSLPNQTVALNQAAGDLQELSIYVEKELWPPEKALYLVLIKNWQSLVAAEQGRLGESVLRQMSPSERLATGLVDRSSEIWLRPAKPLANPYIAGDPVMPPLFVGRRDIFTRINEIWHAKANPDSIILYGHRRMGKSSILRNLDQAAPGRVIAYVNLQGETSFVASTADLLLALADRIFAEVKRARPEVPLTQPPADQFTTPASAQIQFNRFMEQVRTALNESGLILALDEFEAIEEAVRDGKVGKEIYQFLRAKTQEPWITVVFGGLHTLDEMSRDYAQPFYGSYQNIVVSYLAPEDARHLITNPTPDFTVNYELSAVDRIIAATGGQPYLVQLVCRDALDHLNHELFDEHQEREVKIILADVEAVLGEDLFRRGTGYFDGVWTQVSEAAQQGLLRCMAQREEAWTLAELEEATHLTSDELHHHLQLAERRDILRQCDGAPDGAWEFCVPLMRRWIVWKE